MKLLQIYRSKPTEEVIQLASSLSEGNDVTHFNLFEGEVDYARLVELIFANDKTISWW